MLRKVHRVPRVKLSPTQPSSSSPGSPIAGSLLPLSKAEELIASLSGVVSARIVATESGSVDTIHVLVGPETPPKQMVRNIESALMAQLGMRVDHRKISIATTAASRGTQVAGAGASSSGEEPPAGAERVGRVVYFEDVEVRGSRAKGVTCRVTLRIGESQFAGEAEEGMQSERSRVDVAARAALMALGLAGDPKLNFTLEGVKVIEAFERTFVFAGVMVRAGRESVLLTGSCEVRDSAETAAVLAVLDATNRWMESGRAAGVGNTLTRED